MMIIHCIVNLYPEKYSTRVLMLARSHTTRPLSGYNTDVEHHTRTAVE